MTSSSQLRLRGFNSLAFSYFCAGDVPDRIGNGSEVLIAIGREIMQLLCNHLPTTWHRQPFTMTEAKVVGVRFRMLIQMGKRCDLFGIVI